MHSRFVVHRHQTGRSHFDLRIVQNGVLRSWSLLKEPPGKPGERRLAIERESFTIDSINSRSFEEEAFGFGGVSAWDDGEVEFESVSPRLIVLNFAGKKSKGNMSFGGCAGIPGTAG